VNDHFIIRCRLEPEWQFARGLCRCHSEIFFHLLRRIFSPERPETRGSLVENSSGNQKGRNLALVLAGAGAFLCGACGARQRDLREVGARRNRLLSRGKGGKRGWRGKMLPSGSPCAEVEREVHVRLDDSRDCQDARKAGGNSFTRLPLHPRRPRLPEDRRFSSNSSSSSRLPRPHLFFFSSSRSSEMGFSATGCVCETSSRTRTPGSSDFSSSTSSSSTRFQRNIRATEHVSILRLDFSRCSLKSQDPPTSYIYPAYGPAVEAHSPAISVTQHLR